MMISREAGSCKELELSVRHLCWSRSSATVVQCSANLVSACELWVFHNVCLDGLNDGLAH